MGLLRESLKRKVWARTRVAGPADCPVAHGQLRRPLLHLCFGCPFLESTGTNTPPWICGMQLIEADMHMQDWGRQEPHICRLGRQHVEAPSHNYR